MFYLIPTNLLLHRRFTPNVMLGLVKIPAQAGASQVGVERGHVTSVCSIGAAAAAILLPLPASAVPEGYGEMGEESEKSEEND